MLQENALMCYEKKRKEMLYTHVTEWVVSPQDRRQESKDTAAIRDWKGTGRCKIA